MSFTMSCTYRAIFGYEGNSNDLKVVETGGAVHTNTLYTGLYETVCVLVLLDGGLDELVDEMSGGKCLYAFLRVTDPNTQLPKNVLINWVCLHATDLVM